MWSIQQVIRFPVHMTLLLALGILMLLAEQTEGLKCYVCSGDDDSDCAFPDPKKLKSKITECPSGACWVVKYGHEVQRLCEHKETYSCMEKLFGHNCATMKDGNGDRSIIMRNLEECKQEHGVGDTSAKKGDNETERHLEPGQMGLEMGGDGDFEYICACAEELCNGNRKISHRGRKGGTSEQGHDSSPSRANFVFPCSKQKFLLGPLLLFSFYLFSI